MKTTIQIPENELKDLIEYSNAKTKKEAILTAVREYNHRKRMAKLSRILGTFEDFMDQEELNKIRQEQ